MQEPLIAEARARLARACGDAMSAEGFLRESHELYTKVSARGHARRIADELVGA